MNIAILQLIEGARAAQGLTVVIDVFRAFSVACYVIGNDAEKIITVGELEKAYDLKKRNPAYLLIGERHGKRMPGFDYGNSPTELETVDLAGRTVVQTTSAGTQGIVNATAASEIITGSFVNAHAVIDYIRARRPDEVSLVCMGTEALEPSEEDTLCAHYLKHQLEGKTIDFPVIGTHLRDCPNARKFFDDAKPWAPRRDFDLCMDLDRFNFVLRAERDSEGYFALTRIAGA
jgi:2-phosphosulfolactate phosphatase